ncbi:hypothetical protein TNCV_2428131 [Trichonephila clavipes]|nr:hypothetical protein TNCV_2428131 [Trichonephila clavipes]
MPFGLCNAPATFERMMDNLLRHFKWTMCLCYLDDIIVFSETFEDHLIRLRLVLKCLQEAGLKLNSKKCLFAAQEVKILGHLVSSNGVRPDPDKIKAVRNFPTPKNIHDIRSFLGLCSYFRRFIKGFCYLAEPLQSLLKSGVEFHWGPEEVEAFNSLKKALTSDPVLGMYDERASTEIHTDASGYGIGAVLVQIQNNVEKVIAYASRTLTKAEKNYSTTERECLAIVWATNKFRPYIFGKHFTVVTDHHSLCWLMNLKDPSGRLARWALRLQEHDFDVKYKTGKKHSDADALSRNPVEEETETPDKFLAVTTSMNLAMEQKKDQDLPKLKLLSNSSKNEEFRFIDGILCRKNFDPDGKLWLPVIPKHLRADILRHFHDAPTAGHLGFAKTYDRIRKRFYWPGMYRNVVRYVMHCRECQRRKSVPQRPPGRLVPIPPAIAPFHRIGIDLLGRFPKSAHGNKWIIVCTDYSTRYAITKALPTAEVDEIAKFLLEEIVLRHGAPRVIITDRGAVFRSRLVSSLVDLCNIDHRFTTAYHPQTNGLTERFNKTLADMLSMYVDVEQKNWDEILPFVTFAYNTAKQETTGFTPFYLLHGREAETTLDTMLPFCPNDFDDNNITKIAARAEESRQLARVHTLRAQDKDRRRYDSKHQMVSYAPGDLVWIYTPVRKVGLSEKLLRRYFGPYQVLRRLSAVTYAVQDFDPASRKRKTKRSCPCNCVLDESRSFFRVHTGYFSNIPKCIKAEFIASWGCSQSSVVSSSQQDKNADEQEAKPAVVTPSLQQWRSPSTFRGAPGEDPLKWLKEYDRLANFNKWDDMMCLANVYFFLDGTARQWYVNNEDALDSWEAFKNGLSGLFGDRQKYTRRAEEQLKCRAQRSGESTQSYIQSVLGLCQEVNPLMREDEKNVSHLMKGVAEDIYQALLTREINDTASFIKWCNYIEDMKQKRVGRPRFERLPNVVPVASLTDETDLVSLIHTIVREEVHRLVNQTQQSLDSDPQSLEEIVQDEVERVLAPVSTKPTETRPRPTYAAVTRKYRAPVQKFPPEPRKTDVWRTADNRPVCFHCGRPGYVMRYCRERKAVFDNSRNRRRNIDDVGTEEEIRRPTSHERPIPNTSLQIPVAISPIQSVARP